MKKITFAVLAVIMLCSFHQRAFAQTGSGRYFSVGPIFTLGASTLAGDVTEGWKIGPKFGFTFGAFSELDLSDAISFDLGLAYESRARYWYRENNESGENYTAELGYLTITPLFNFNHFLLGFGIRMPMSGTLIGKGQNVPTPFEGNHDIASSDLKTAIDLKLGGNIPVLQTAGGVLNVIILGGYDLTKAFGSRTVSFDWGQPEASLQLGLNYQFNVTELK